MPLWLVRTGPDGEHERRFLQTDRIYITWEGLNRDLSARASKRGLQEV